MKKDRMYSELAKYYDLIYGWKDYEKESQKIHNIIKKYKKTSGKDLLDVACGTGGHIQFLKHHYRIVGIDLNKEMLGIAKKKFPKIKFVKADMAVFDLKRRFDIIICLFGSIGYMKTYNNLKKAVNNFSKHLNPGGLVLIEDFVPKKDYKIGIPWANFIDKPNVKIARMNLSKRRGDIAIVDFHFLIATKKGVEYLRDYHELGLFDINKFLRIMKENNFEAKYLKDGLMNGRGLYIGIKSSN
ncbi:class I SAM-dependent methyltransferase [Candidatus Woesearchaeota archaeon]|nr:class I SAM-dependent methyltransferase [Candidatus Woesearchaeota archaeon]